MDAIGLVSTGIYLPKDRITSIEISELSGIPIDVVENKMGIKEKTIPSIDDHTAAMGSWAAQKAISKAKIDPLEIDLIIYIGEEHKEYPLWTAGIKLQHDVGAKNAWAFDVALRCGTTIMAIKLAKDMMTSDPGIGTVLLAGGYRNIDFINYNNPRTRFMYNLGAGGGAMVLKRAYKENEVLGTHMITDGSFSEDVIVTTGGTKNPITVSTLQAGLYQLDVPDSEGMKKRLERKSMKNFIHAIDMALKKSGYTRKDIGFLALLHMKRSAHHFILEELGVTTGKSIYLENYGHIGQIDQILSLELAEKKGKLNKGDIVVLVSAGIGYAWGATVIKWGK